VEPTAALNGGKKSRSHRDSISGPSSPGESLYRPSCWRPDLPWVFSLILTANNARFCAVSFHIAIFRNVTPELKQGLNIKSMACGLVVPQKTGTEM
jgi:hypothetical protein